MLTTAIPPAESVRSTAVPAPNDSIRPAAVRRRADRGFLGVRTSDARIEPAPAHVPSRRPLTTVAMLRASSERLNGFCSSSQLGGASRSASSSSAG